jgi:MoxR-like ATPase
MYVANTSNIESRVKPYHTMRLGGIDVHVPAPDEPEPRPIVGRKKLVERILVALQAGLHATILGPPGCGKNEIAYGVGRQLGVPMWVLHAHSDMLPEDCVLTGRPAGERIELCASPALAAALEPSGGLLIIDEASRMPPRTWSVFASLLDRRSRELHSVLGGFTIRAPQGFRVIAVMNPEDGVSALPDFIKERLLPVLKIDQPPADDILEIVRSNLPHGDASLLGAFRGWCQKHQGCVSPRKAVTMMTYAASAQLAMNVCPLGADEARCLIDEAAAMVDLA